MALSKFDEWVYREMGEALPSVGGDSEAQNEKEEHEQIEKLKGSLGAAFNNLMKKVDSVKFVNKQAARQILEQIIKQMMDRAKLSGQETSKLTGALGAIGKHTA